MVDTVFFLLQFIGLGVLLHWALTHDKPDDSAAETGILAMRPMEPATAEEGRCRPKVTPGFRRSGRSGRDRRRSGSG
ncbi:MAG: hypothetical protein AB7I59_00500 [Geminicoccaceae bacterium]